jgi:hypothetical protein
MKIKGEKQMEDWDEDPEEETSYFDDSESDEEE